MNNDTFQERNGKTTLSIEVSTTADWEEMFNDGWPEALKKLKEISEASFRDELGIQNNYLKAQ